MIPVVNMEIKMPSKMFKALCRLETVCAVTERNHMSETEVRRWLAEKFDKALAESFRPEFLSSPSAGASLQ
jgi:hypothetical protein